jgi:DNA topoisomerase-3
VTDHHAIIPTGVIPHGLSDAEQKVFDLVARRFIGVFLPDCKFSTTTVLGEVRSDSGSVATESQQTVESNAGVGSPTAIEFKVTGKEILDPGWRVVRGVQASENTENSETENAEKNDEERTLPTFVKGESGEHVPTLTEKMTTPPPYYTEATLLRAMETAGKFVEDETLRAAMKENGIGRPSSRASIIETLFKRHYIKREKKRLVATPTGIELIDLIREELLKSCELTGIWEKKLRDIEHQKYDATQFIEELKAQVAEIVNEVMSDSSNRRVTVLTDAELKKVKSKTKKIAEGQPCPLCGQGRIIKGKTAYGCSRWKEGCTYRAPFT